MRRFVAVRLLHALVVLVLVATAAFALLHLAPGDPFSFENPAIPASVRAQWRARFGYDRPLAEQYVRYLGALAHGDLGYSHSLNIPVRDALAVTLPRTLLLMGSALVLSFAIGIWLGVFEARFPRTRRARATNAATLLLYSIPDFWLALMLLLAFGYWLPVLPAGGIVDPVMHSHMRPAAAVGDVLRHLILPLLSLTLLASAFIARYQRAALREVLAADFVRTARAKGLGERAVVGRHAWRNALLPMITLAGLSLPALLGGSVFVERVYSWPGMGLLVVNAIGTRDYALVIAAVVIGAVLVVLGSLLADVGYALADPRVRVR